MHYLLIHLNNIQYPGHHCSFYDMDKNSVKANFHQSCKKHEIPCPKFYLSNSSFECKYEMFLVEINLKNKFSCDLLINVFIYVIKNRSCNTSKHLKILFLKSKQLTGTCRCFYIKHFPQFKKSLYKSSIFYCC